MRSIYYYLMREETIIAEVKDYGEVEIYDYDGDSKTFSASQGSATFIICGNDILSWRVNNE